jgi:FtsX-like permease family
VPRERRARALRLHRLALVRLRARWPASAALGLALAAAVALSTAVALVDAMTAEAGLQDTVHQLGPARYLEVDARQLLTTDDYASNRSRTIEVVGEALGPLERLRQVRLQTDYVAVERGQAQYADAGPAPAVRLAALEDLDRHVEVVESGVTSAPWAAGVLPVTAPEAAARSLGLRPGQVACFDTTTTDTPLRAFCAGLAGVWRARDPHDPYWAERPPPTELLTVDVPGLIAVAQQAPRSRPLLSATTSLLFEPDLAALHQDRVDDVLAGLRRLRVGIPVRGGSALVTTDLDRAVEAFEDRLRLGRFVIELVAAQLLLITALAVAFLSGHALRGQRHTFAVWRSRGWSWHAIWRLLLLEAAGLALPALPAGILVGWLAAVLLARRAYGGQVAWLPPWRPEPLLAAVGLGLGAAVAVMAAQAYAASRRELLEVRRDAARPALRGWWQWRALDLGLAALSLPLLATTRMLGQGDVRAHGAGGVAADPLGLALPGVALLLVAVALLRLLPLAGTIAGLGARRLATALAALQLRRRPVQHSGLALLLIVTTALGVFASVYASSAPRGAADRAAYAVGADIRAHLSGTRPPLADVVAGLEGVQAASFVYRGSGTTAAGPAFQPTVLAVDPATFGQVVWSRPDLAARPLPDLVRELGDRDPDGLALPGRPDRIGLAVSTTGFAARVVADVVDGTGRPGRADLGSLAVPGSRRLEAGVVLPAPVRYPLRLRDLAILPDAQAVPPSAPRAGALALIELAVGGAGDPEPAVVDRFRPDDQGRSAWWRAPGPRGDVGLRVTAAAGGGSGVGLDYDPRDGVVTIRPPLSRAPIPALAPAATLVRSGLQLGRPFSIEVGSITTQLVVVDVVDRFPSIYPEAEDALIVAQARLLAQIAQDTGEPVGPPDAWLRVAERADAADVAALEARGDVVSVQDRRRAEAAARRDPVLRELETNLLLGLGAAVALMALSVLLHFLVITRDRLGESAILQAIGLGRGTIHRSLAVEQALLVAFGSGAGALAGLALAWVLIPALQLGNELAERVPPTPVTVDPVGMGATIAAIALLGLAAARLASRAGGRVRLMAELRLLG